MIYLIFYFLDILYVNENKIELNEWMNEFIFFIFFFFNELYMGLNFMICYKYDN